MLAQFLLLLLPVLVPASIDLHKRASGVTSDPSSTNNQTFDYVIVGAGLAGTTVAARLSEDPSKTVLLIEAGNDDREDPRVYDFHRLGETSGTDLEWLWTTDLDRGIRGGRTLGGSTSVNGAAWNRAMKAQYDALSLFLEEGDSMGWNFDSLFHYMKKSEGFTPPSDEQRSRGANSVDAFHGFEGPVQVAFSSDMYSGPQQPAFVDAIRNVTGIAYCPDVGGGDANCVTFVPHTINSHENDNRSSAATAYLSPVEDERPNWLTLVGHQVTRVLFSKAAVPNVTAVGVQFKKSDNAGEIFAAYASQDIILAAGAIGTPQLLQLSGIGDPSVLEPLGIPVKVDLPTVGRNLQEKTMNIPAHTTLPTFDKGGDNAPSDALAFPSLKELFSEKGGSNGSVTPDQVAESIMALYPSWAQSQATNALNAEALTEIFGVQSDLIVNGRAPVAELFFFTGINQILIGTWQTLPFSRGNVTITDPSVFTKPKVTVNWFSVDYDLSVQIAGVRLARNVLNNPTFVNISAGETLPGTDVVPNNDGDGGTDEAWRAWILAPSPNGFSAVSHEIGTAAMMRRDLGGVVDSKLRVYDTANLRVVDASILPLEVGVHPTSSLYGIAEKAADIIKSGV